MLLEPRVRYPPIRQPKKLLHLMVRQLLRTIPFRDQSFQRRTGKVCAESFLKRSFCLRVKVKNDAHGDTRSSISIRLTLARPRKPSKFTDPNSIRRPASTMPQPPPHPLFPNPQNWYTYPMTKIKADAKAPASDAAPKKNNRTVVLDHRIPETPEQFLRRFAGERAACGNSPPPKSINSAPETVPKSPSKAHTSSPRAPSASASSPTKATPSSGSTSPKFPMTTPPPPPPSKASLNSSSKTSPPSAAPASPSETSATPAKKPEHHAPHLPRSTRTLPSPRLAFSRPLPNPPINSHPQPFPIPLITH